MKVKLLSLTSLGDACHISKSSISIACQVHWRSLDKGNEHVCTSKSTLNNFIPTQKLYFLKRKNNVFDE